MFSAIQQIAENLTTSDLLFTVALRFLGVAAGAAVVAVLAICVAFALAGTILDGSRNRVLVGTLFLGGVATASLLSGCGPDAGQASSEDGVPAVAGLAGTPGTGISGQDSTPMVVRRVWGGAGAGGTDVSPDGRHLVFVDEAGNLAVREFGTGETRSLTDDASWVEQWAESGAISSDGRQVAYSWYRIGQEHPYELRVVGWDGGSSRVLFGGESFQWFGAGEWSADGEQILISGLGEDESYQLALVSVADGSVRTLKNLGSLWPVEVSFSPDDRYLVYDIPEGSNSEERDIFVINLATGEETPLGRHPANDFVLGWAPDGAHVLFASDRSGALGVWLQPVENGRADGDPRMVKADLWRVSPIGFAEDGSFFFGIDLDSEKINIATLDPETGAVLAPPIPVSGDRLASEDSPRWSPDGRYLAYRSLEGQQAGWYTGEQSVSIRSVETGETRKLRVPDLEIFGGDFLWFPDGHHLLLVGVDRDDRDGVFKIDVQTGEAEPLPAFWDMDLMLIGWSADGRSLFYRPRLDEGNPITIMDLESGDKRVVYDQEANRIALSPDGESLAFAVGGGGERSIMLMPSTGGVPRELARFQTENDYNVFAVTWSTDGRYVFYVRPWDGTRGLWRVPVSGGPPEEVELSGIWTGISFHPDGRRLAFETRQTGAEIWVMENFLPDQAEAGVSR